MDGENMFHGQYSNCGGDGGWRVESYLYFMKDRDKETFKI